MPLFVPNDFAYMEYILPDILKIVDKDTGIGDARPENPALLEITYNPTKQGFAQTQFFNIVRGTPNFAIILKYVESSFKLPEDPQIPIAERQGATYGPGMGTDNPDNSGFIYIFLDAFNDVGANYWVQGQDVSQIFSPRWVQLFHELSHALHIADGLVTKNTPEAQENALTIGDENKLRAQYKSKHPWLKQRNPNEVGGTGITDPEPDFNNPRPSSPCFIVSAAYGSPQASQVRRFQQLRDDLLRRSAFGNEFFAQVAAEYYQFSPQIATDMNASQALRLSVSKLIVEPLVDFFTLLEFYVRGGWQQKNFGDHIENILTRFLKELPRAGFSSDRVELICLEIERLNTRLERRVGRAREWKVPSIPSSCAEVAPVLNYLANVVEANTLTTKYIVWAVMAPLIIYWSALRRLNSQQAQAGNLGVYAAEILDNWLGTVPIPPTFEGLGERTIQDSLSQLSETIFTIPRVRQKIGSRLLESYGDLVPYDLKAVLQRTDYLSLFIDDK